MREILFRGKLAKSGKWAEGNLVVNMRGVCVVTPDETPLGTYGQVIPETVGQFTGLTDKDGEKIFEGDILYDIYNESNCLITFDEGSFCIIDDNVCCSAFSCSMNAFEIIGHIHDNPELLRIEKE